MGCVRHPNPFVRAPGSGAPVPRIDIVRGDPFSRAKAPKNRAEQHLNLTIAPGRAISTTGDDTNPNAPPETTLRGMLATKHDKWQVGHENGYDESDTVWRKFRCRNKAKGHELLEAVQDELYVPNEQGCRIRRESQGMFYMCCDGVRVRLNETKSEVLVEVPLPRETNAEIAACDKTLRVVEDLAKKSGCKV